MALNLDLYIDQGTDFTAILPAVTDATGTVIDLTTYTPNSQLRRSYSSLQAVTIGATVTDAVHGIITLTMGNLETAGLDPLRYVYDVTITDGGGVITKVFDGLIIVNSGVTAKPETTLYVPFIPDDFGGL